MARVLYPIFKKIWEEEQVPTEWKEFRIPHQTAKERRPKQLREQRDHSTVCTRKSLLQDPTEQEEECR
jgi:hypothetical protein